MNTDILAVNPNWWSYSARKLVDPILEQIMQLPFILALGDGSLPQEKFIFYLQQDVLYLQHYSQIMNLIAAKCPSDYDAQQFRRFSTETIKAEQSLQQDLLQHKEIVTQQAPSCLFYTAFLYQQLATKPLPVIIASILPCFYIYQQVGKQLLSHKNIHTNPYLRWIEAYNCPEYCRDCEIAIAIADRMATENGTAIAHSMLQGFLTAARLEWQLWNGCWQMTNWPI